MKNIINKNANKGYILKIEKSDSTFEKVFYAYYDNGCEYASTISREIGNIKVNKDIVSDIGYNTNDFKNYISEQSLLFEKSGSELATQNNQCWVFNKGAGNVNNTVRVSIPSDLIAEQIFTGSNIDLLIASYRTPYAAYTNHCKYTIVIYFVTLPAPDRAILEAYASRGVIIENKI